MGRPTPGILASDGGTPPALEHKAWQAEVWINTGGTAWTPGPDEETVRAVLSELAVPDTWITAQVHYALTGRTCAPSDHPGPPR